MNRKLLILMVGGYLATLTGCYTQFVTLNYEQPPEDSTIAADTSRAVVQKIDTVRTMTRQTCYWTRNFFGEPELRCFDDNRYSYYTWDRYYNYPWWYRFDRIYGYEWCPQRYYYDPSCDCCRYDYNYNYSRPNYSSGGGSSVEPSQRMTPRRSVGGGFVTPAPITPTSAGKSTSVVEPKSNGSSSEIMEKKNPVIRRSVGGGFSSPPPQPKPQSEPVTAQSNNGAALDKVSDNSVVQPKKTEAVPVTPEPQHPDSSSQKPMQRVRRSVGGGF